MDDTDVSRLLSRALEALNEARIPDDLREVAFTTAIGLLVGGQPAPPQPPTTLGVQQNARPPGGHPSTGSAVLDAIAQNLEVAPDSVRQVFTEKNGEPELTIKSSKLPRTKAAAAADIAMLVMAGRQGSGLDDYTEARTLRDTCRRYGKFDQSNFSSQMKALDNHIITEGRGVSARRKLTHPGIEAAAELVRAYAGEG